MSDPKTPAEPGGADTGDEIQAPEPGSEPGIGSETGSEIEPEREGEHDAPAGLVEAHEAAGTTAAKKRRTLPAPRWNPWYTVATVAVIIVVLVAFGYFAALGPFSRLSTGRAIHPPAQLDGLGRRTDPETRQQYQLDQLRDLLKSGSKGLETTVDAYGDSKLNKLFIVIAQRGRLDIDQEVKSSGASGNQVQKFGEVTCVLPSERLATCYRTSRTLTVMVRDGTGELTMDKVAPVTDSAFDAMK